MQILIKEIHSLALRACKDERGRESRSFTRSRFGLVKIKTIHSTGAVG